MRYEVTLYGEWERTYTTQADIRMYRNGFNKRSFDYEPDDSWGGASVSQPFELIELTGKTRPHMTGKF